MVLRIITGHIFIDNFQRKLMFSSYICPIVGRPVYFLNFGVFIYNNNK